MALSNMIASAKPYAVGGLIGAVAVLTVGFSGNMIVSTSTMQDEVAGARIAAYGELCRQNAHAHWTSEGKQMSELDGWRNETREALAEQFAADLTSSADLNGRIADRCDDLLQPT